MKKASILVAASVCCAAPLLYARNASALGPIDLEIGAKVGGATNPLSAPSGLSGVSIPNPLGFGLGARGGVSFLGFYGGVQLMYYFGSSQNESILGQSISTSEHAFLYGIEAGYGLSLSILTIRPQLGIGNASFSGSGSLSGVANVNIGSSKDNLYLEPGVTGLISLGTWFVGADANVLVFPGLDNSQAAFSLHGQIGIKL